MKKQTSLNPDKNLINTVDELSVRPTNSHQAQQIQQDRRDRRNEALKNS
ncbi:MAG: hypothetical protein K0Q77_497 [Anaerosporomusa subterranea]|jgi:hypothetical protein|nr:hypothetical protein [Anaerosporomusa subterranea]